MSLFLLVAALVCFIIAAVAAFSAETLGANAGGFVALGLAFFVSAHLARDHYPNR